jgi:hypothetical protein
MDGKDAKNDPQDVQRWSAKRKAAVILEILRGKTTPQDAWQGRGIKYRPSVIPAVIGNPVPVIASELLRGNLRAC